MRRVWWGVVLLAAGTAAFGWHYWQRPLLEPMPAWTRQLEVVGPERMQAIERLASRGRESLPELFRVLERTDRVRVREGVVLVLSRIKLNATDLARASAAQRGGKMRIIDLLDLYRNVPPESYGPEVRQLVLAVARDISLSPACFVAAQTLVELGLHDELAELIVDEQLPLRLRLGILDLLREAGPTLDTKSCIAAWDAIQARLGRCSSSGLRQAMLNLLAMGSGGGPRLTTLWDQLGREGDAPVRRDLARAWLHNEDVPSLELWLEGTADPDAVVRFWFMETLARLPLSADPQRLLSRLEQCAEDSDEMVRWKTRRAIQVAAQNPANAATLQPLLERLKLEPLPPPTPRPNDPAEAPEADEVTGSG